MPSPATYAAWAARANPKCPICRGLGYARYKPQPQVPIGHYVLRGLLPPESKGFEGACECLSPTQNTTQEPEHER